MSPLSLIANPTSDAACQRWMIWIDGGGAYEVLWPMQEVTIGSPDKAGEQERLEILAPISRRQFQLTRDGGQFRLTPLKPIRLNGRETVDAMVLTSGDVLAIEPGVTFTFRMPSPLSQTGVLQVTSTHRWSGGADGIVFLDRLCLIGREEDCPIRVRHYDQRLVLFVHGEGLHIKSLSEPLKAARPVVENEILDVHGLRVRMTRVTNSISSQSPVSLQGAKAR